MSNHVLTITCKDQVGIVSAVSTFLADHQCNIIDSHQYGDPDTGQFFMRVRTVAVGGDVTLDELRSEFAVIGEKFEMDWAFHDRQHKCRTIVMVSKFGHCLNDLLFRWRTGSLDCDIRAIVSNHRDFEELAAANGIPFHHLPVTPETKAEQEAALLDLVDVYDAELVVLARYMQVLTDDLCRKMEGRVINIHHSFLPSFKGAKPYHQAHARGVKLIGATAHYVTPDLDEGPIIEQEIARVDHNTVPAELVTLGRDAEAIALARAVQWHAQHRVLLNGTKTVVFR